MTTREIKNQVISPNQQQKQNTKIDLKKYRNLLWDSYDFLTDEEVESLTVQIRAFITPIINKYIQNFSDNKGKSLSLNTEKNE